MENALQGTHDTSPQAPLQVMKLKRLFVNDKVLNRLNATHQRDHPLSYAPIPPPPKSVKSKAMHPVQTAKDTQRSNLLRLPLSYDFPSSKHLREALKSLKLNLALIGRAK